MLGLGEDAPKVALANREEVDQVELEVCIHEDDATCMPNLAHVVW